MVWKGNFSSDREFGIHHSHPYNKIKAKQNENQLFFNSSEKWVCRATCHPKIRRGRCMQGSKVESAYLEQSCWWNTWNAEGWMPASRKVRNSLKLQFCGEARIFPGFTSRNLSKFSRVDPNKIPSGGEEK